MRLQSAHLVTEASQTHWAQAYHQAGVLLLIEVKGEPEEGVAPLGKRILDKLISVIEPEAVNNLSFFTQAVDKVLNQLNTSVAVTIIAAKMVSDILYLLIRAGGSVLIFREGKLAVIGDKEGSASGVVKVGDRLFFLSSSLSHLVEIKDLFAIADLTIQEAAEVLVGLLHQQNKVNGAALVVAVEQEPPSQLKDEQGDLSSSDGSLTVSATSRILEKGVGGTIKEMGRKATQGITRRFMATWQKLRWLYLGRNNRPRWWSILVVLLFLFLVSISFGMVKREHKERSRQLEQVKERVEHEIDEAEALIGINAIRARDLLRQARERLEPLGQTFSQKSAEGQEVVKLLLRVKELEAQAARVFRLSNPAVFYDLSLVRPEAKGSAIALYRKNLVVLDLPNKAVYSILLTHKRAEIVAGGEKLVQPKLVAVHGERVFIFTDQGIVMAATQEGKVELVVPTDSDWGEIVDMVAFAGNVYLLDSGTGKIWKYPATESGLGEKILWLSGDTLVKFQKGSRMAIDGAIWTITGEQIHKFIQGRVDSTFSISGLDEALSLATAIYTDDVANYLYILDREKNRVVVFDKDGKYQSQYVVDINSGETQMVVSEEEGKIFLTKDNLIYGIDIMDR